MAKPLTKDQVDRKINSLIAQGALFVSNHSGGKDSMALLITLAKRIPARQLIVVHASLGEVEWEGAQEKAQEHAESLGLPFFVARASKTLFQKVTGRRQNRPGAPSWPDARNRWCTSDLKRDPIAKVVRGYAKEHGFTTVVNCLGLRGQESTSRAKKPLFQVGRDTCKSRQCFDWLPIHQMLVEEVWNLIATQAVKRHHAYDLGNERLSCVFCIFGSKCDLANGHEHNLDLYAKYVALEKETGYSMHVSKKWLQELVLGPEA